MSVLIDLGVSDPQLVAFLPAEDMRSRLDLSMLVHARWHLHSPNIRSIALPALEPADVKKGHIPPPALPES